MGLNVFHGLFLSSHHSVAAIYELIYGFATDSYDGLMTWLIRLFNKQSLTSAKPTPPLILKSKADITFLLVKIGKPIFNDSIAFIFTPSRDDIHAILALLETSNEFKSSTYPR